MTNKLKFFTKTEIVYEKLKEDIISGILRQGEKIIAREISKELGVSDIPVREALKKLETEGLVENIPYVGSRVSQINLKKAAEIFAVRLELEAFATRLAAENAKAEEIDELQKIVDEIDEINHDVQNTDLKKISRLNKAFHRRLYELSGNEVLCEHIFSLMDRSQYSQSIFAYLPNRQEYSNEEHQSIVDALRKGNVTEAEEAFRKHKKYAFAEFLNKLKLEKSDE